MQPSNQCCETGQYVNDYNLHFLLGEGGQASVYLGSKDKKFYAIKIYGFGISKEEGFKRQVQFLQKLKFKYLISIIEADANADVKFKNRDVEKRSIIVLEFAQGELFDFIAKQGRFTPQICRTLIRQLIDAIKFLNEQGITHRDLKPQNILFDEDFNFKVSDFGLSTFIEGPKGDGRLSSLVGTQGYKPPEMQLGKYTGIQADIFATGVILFIMYNGTPPFLSTKPGDKIYQLIKNQNYAKFWALHEKKKPAGFYPDSFKRLINEFFSYDPSKRPTFASLSENQWLNSDTAMGQELKTYFKQRLERMTADDQVKKKIAKLRKQMFENQKMEQESNKNSSTRGSDTKVFTQRLNQYNNVKISELPQTEKNIKYFSEDICFVLAFINDYMDQCAENTEICLPEFLQEIKPESFEMRFDGQQIELRFNFELDEDEDEELKLRGKLYQKEGKQVGIEWQKVSGNDFWLNKILRDLNKKLEVLL